MNINKNTMISIYEANQNISKVARLVDQYGSAVILKNTTPRYMIVEFEQADEIQDDVLNISRKIMERNRTIYEELSK